MSHGDRKIKIAFLFFSTSNEKNFFPLASNSYSILKSEFIKKGTRFSLFFLIKIFENSSRKVFSKLSKRNKLCLNRRYWIFRFSYLLRIFFLFFRFLANRYIEFPIVTDRSGCIGESSGHYGNKTV